MNKLVEEIIKPILNEMPAPKIKKIIGVYGGRFQPFGPHHLKTYKWLARQVDDAYISTSNIKKPPRHPMNFKEKVRHMSKMGVPSSKIIQEKTPYVAKNLQSKFDPDTTAFVYVFGAKDAGRLGGSGKYYKDFKKNRRNLVGYEEHGYYLTAPHVSISVGGKEVSGTSMRELLGSSKIDDKDRVKLFKKMFGYYDKGLFQMMTNKFKKLFESDMEFKPTSMYYVPSKKRPLNKKLKDGEGSELLQDIELDLDVGDTVLMGKFKNKKVLVKSIGYNEKGDLTINGKSATRFRMFKKAPKVPKSPFDEIEIKLKNGQPRDKEDLEKWLVARAKEMVKTRGYKKGSSYHKVKEDVSVTKKKGKDGGDYRTYTEPENSDVDEPHKRDNTAVTGKIEKLKKNEVIEQFLTTIDMKEIIKEVTSTGNAGDADEFGAAGQQLVDSGPNMFFGGKGGYFGRNEISAEELGWEVVDYILGVKNVNRVPPLKKDLDGDRSAVSSLPAGIGTGTTPNNPENLTGAKGYNKWVRTMKKIAQTVGMGLMDFMDKEEKETKKQISKDSRETLKKQKEEEKEEVVIEPMGESVLTKDWWKETIKEELVTKDILKPRRKELLLMGGAYGHMAHPFDDKNLKFADLKYIIVYGLGGQLNREDNVTEKLDGQNLMISWKDGKLIAARNKGHIKNGGQNALDAKGISGKFAGRGEIANAFNFAMRDLEKAIKSLSQKQKDKVFDNGHNFMNLEVMWPKSANVIDYDVAQIVFHGALRYDDNGNVIGEVGGARMLAGMIKQVNQHIQNKYSIGKPHFLTIPKHQDFGKMKDKFLSRVDKLKSKYGLKDSDTLALYHQKYWESFIRKQNKKVSSKVLKGLVKRWAFFDKSYSVSNMKRDIKDEKFLEWVLKFDKNNHAKQVKENMRPFEVLFFELGAEILKNVQGFIAANPNKAVQNMKSKLSSAISAVRSGGDLKKLNRLKTQLDRLDAIGGTDAIVPSEGIVFKYKGKTYKFTGAFAPVNQITGLIHF